MSRSKITNTQIRKSRTGGELTPGKLAMKVLKLTLDAHVKLDPDVAPLLPRESWPEIEYRLKRLQERVQEFLDAREAKTQAEERRFEQ